jgi:hypothetical protein
VPRPDLCLDVEGDEEDPGRDIRESVLDFSCQSELSSLLLHEPIPIAISLLGCPFRYLA